MLLISHVATAIRSVAITSWAIGFLGFTAPAHAEERQSVGAYFFGNSLVNHLSDVGTTNVPQWLNTLAKADDRSFAMDGQWGFIRDFARSLPPRPNWSFPGVSNVWNTRIQRFANAKFNAIVVNPANFVQYQSPEAPYDGDNPTNESPAEATARLLAWVNREKPESVLYIYEGWAEMAGIARSFPPTAKELAKYQDFNAGDYHDWFVDYRDAVAKRLPDADVRLIPVASVIAKVLSSDALSDLSGSDLYLDDAPHGQPTLYFLASLVTYASLYGVAPPVDIDLQDEIHPTVRDNYAKIAQDIWELAQPGEDQAAAETSAPDPVPAPVQKPIMSEPQTSVEIAQIAETDTPSGVPALAMGLNGIADWSTQHPFIDVMKTARPWVGHLPGQWGGVDMEDLRAGGHLNENGWPISIPQNVEKLETFIFTDQPEADLYLHTNWEVRFKGKGSLQIGGRAERIKIDDGTGQFFYKPGDGLVSIAITETDPNDPIRDIVIVRADQMEMYEAGALFNPVWLSRIENLRSIRYMDWMQTNGSNIQKWEDRPSMSDFSWVKKGVPLEVMVALANQIGADPWFNMPHMADDEYVRNFATYVRESLDPRLMAYVEYSNEVWNFIFSQAHYSAQEGEKLWGKTQTGWMEYYGLRSAQVMDIWTDVFGDDTEKRLVRTAATHSGWQGLEEYVLTSDRAKDALGKMPYESFDAYAVTGYFGYEMGGEEFASRMTAWLDDSEAVAKEEAEAKGLQRVSLREYVDLHRFERANAPVAKALKDGSLKELIEVIFPYHAQAASNAGLDLVMYEGGTHVAGHGDAVSDERLTDFFKQFNYTPEMAEIYQSLLDGWTSAGGKLFNAFVDVAPASQWGSWGSLRYLSDSNPRWDALMAFNAAGDGGWQSRDVAAFANGLNLNGSDRADVLEGSVEEDVILGGGGDDTLKSNGGNDYIHGGPGEDMAILPGALQDYSFAMRPGGIIASAGFAKVHLASVEYLEFADDGIQIPTVMLQ